MPKSITQTGYEAGLRRRVTNAEVDAIVAEKRLENTKQQARDLLFDMALRQNKLAAAIRRYKKEWPELAEEIHRIAEEESALLDNDEEFLKELKRKVAANI